MNGDLRSRGKVLGMALPRRRFLQLATSVFAAPTLIPEALAQAYPARPVRLVVGYAAGGATDITARLIADDLSKRLGQQFVVENRPGAATNIATEFVARAAPDGHTLLVATAANAINATLYRNLKFNFIQDMAPVAGLIRMQNVLEVNPNVPVRSVAELIAYAKAQPDKLTVGSPGIGSPGYVASELLKMMTGIKMLHVPYRGIAPALSDLLAGRIQVLVDNMATALPYIESGKVRALGVTTATRSNLLPDLPTIAETVPGYEASSWFGVTAPKGTPPEVIAILNKAINAGLSDQKIVQRFTDLGGTPMPGTPADFGRFLVDETEKWGKVVRFAGAKIN